MKAPSKPTEEREELRTKLDYEGQLIWRFGQFFNNCESDDAVKAERSLANIYNFLTPDLRKKVDERTDYDNPREIREDVREEIDKVEKVKEDKEETEKKLEEATDVSKQRELREDLKWRERELDTRKTTTIILRARSKDYKEINKEESTRDPLTRQQLVSHQHYQRYSDKAIPKLQKFGRHILDMLDKEGRLFETRRFGHGTEE